MNVPTERDVQQSLSLLGSSPDEIANTLFNKGITRVCRNPEECVVARYLAEQFPGWRVGVDRRGAALERNGYPLVEAHWNWHSPVGTFIGEFDQRKRPELVA